MIFDKKSYVVRSALQPVRPIAAIPSPIEKISPVGCESVGVLLDCELAIKASFVEAERKPPTSREKINEPRHGLVIYR